MSDSTLVKELTGALINSLRKKGLTVVPIAPTFDMKMAGARAITPDHMKKMANYDASCDCWDAMIAVSQGLLEDQFRQALTKESQDDQ